MNACEFGADTVCPDVHQCREEHNNVFICKGKVGHALLVPNFGFGFCSFIERVKKGT